MHKGAAHFETIKRRRRGASQEKRGSSGKKSLTFASAGLPYVDRREVMSMAKKKKAAAKKAAGKKKKRR